MVTTAGKTGYAERLGALDIRSAPDIHMLNLVPSPLLIALEQWHAWRTSRRLLKIYWIIRMEQPELRGIALYERDVARREHLRSKTPYAIVPSAAEIFTLWPVKRDIRFRDVVHYLAVDDDLQSHRTFAGIRSDMRTMVELIISGAL